MPHVVTLTMNPSVDESTFVDRVVPEHKLRCSHPRYDPGGGGVNVARAMHHLGGECHALIVEGGVTGGLLSRLLTAEGVPFTAIDIEGNTRINLHVEEQATGAQYRFNMPGPVLTEADLRAVLAAIEAHEPAPDYFVVSGSLPEDVPDGFCAQAVAAGNARGARVVLDTSGPALRRALAEGVFLVKPNQRELGELLSARVDTPDAVADAARELIRRRWCEAVVVSMAEKGALLVTAEETYRAVPPPVKALSKVGAGDSAVGGIMVKLAAGAGLREAVRFGVAAGTAAVMSEGTQLCRLADVERLVELIAP